MIDSLREIPTDRFNRACAALGLAFLLITQAARSALDLRHPRGAPGQDFAQYYMGGLVALHGQWSDLYPIPHPGALTNAGFSDSSDVHDGYRKLADDAGIGGDFSMRFFQPPPAALLFAPFALLPYRASQLVWTLLLTLATWSVARQAGEVHALSLGRRTKWIGILMLLICCSLQAHRWIRVGNLSAIIGWLIGFTVLELTRGDGPRAALSLVLGTILKYALLVLTPLLVAARRWRTLAWAVAFGIGIVALSLAVTGAGPYRVFFGDIVPTLGRTTMIGENQALYRFLLSVQGVGREDGMPRAAAIVFRVLQTGSLLLILVMVFVAATHAPPLSSDKKGDARVAATMPATIFSAALALVAWLLIFSPIFWEHYHAYLAPFWGWLIYEGSKSTPRRIAVIAAIAMAFAPTSIMLKQAHVASLPEPIFSHLLCSAVIMLAMAIVALLTPRTQMNYSPSQPADSGRCSGAVPPT